MNPPVDLLIGVCILVVLGVWAVLEGAAAWRRHRHQPSPSGEACEHYDHDQRKPCPNPATLELSETWLEPEFGAGAGTGCTAYFCADHAPVGAVPIA